MDAEDNAGAGETSPKTKDKAEKIEKKDLDEKSEDKMNVDESQVNSDIIIKTG